MESYTLQVLPHHLRAKAIHAIASFMAPGGMLLIIARGREPEESKGHMPWPLTRTELSHFAKQGLNEVFFEDYFDHECPPVRRFRVSYQRMQKK